MLNNIFNGSDLYCRMVPHRASTGRHPVFSKPPRPISQKCPANLNIYQGGSREFPIVGYRYFFSHPVTCFLHTTPRLVSCQCPQSLQVNLVHLRAFFLAEDPRPFPARQQIFHSNLYLTDIIVVDDDPQSNFHLHLLLGLCRV